MKFTGLLFLCVCTSVLFGSSQIVGWRGIVPLHSTRGDVERILGKPNFDYELYDFDSERVSIMYSNDPCSGGMKGSYTVPRDTVVSIDISPKKKVMVADIGIDLRKYKKTTDPLIEVHSFYSNEEDGITIGTFEGGGTDNGKILRIQYGPTDKDHKLRCSAASILQNNKTGSSGTKQIGQSTSPISDPCPTIVINKPSADSCSRQLFSLSAIVTGVDPHFSATYKWSVLAGTVIRGQGTDVIEVERTKRGKEQVSVTLEVDGIIPTGCTKAVRYFSECP